ncbi:MAG: hypothetical protein IJ197_01195 [Bacteroidaceae bacterium]|nr:hypothetical protein [Bacteroidaceae bacterium]
MPTYFKKEIADLNGTGEKQYRYEMRSLGNAGTEQLARELHMRMRMLSQGEFVGILSEMSRAIAYLLAQGYTVTIDELGTFATSLGLDDYADETPEQHQGGEPNSSRLHVTDIKFRPHRSFVYEVDKRCHGNLQRDTQGIRPLRRSPYSLDERIQRALAHIREHGYMRLSDYVNLTGLSRATASRELQRLCADKSSPLRSQGLHSHKVYVERK